MRPETFAADFGKMMAAINEFCAKQDLPKPTMVVHPQWRNAIRATHSTNDVLYRQFDFMGVPVRVGQFEDNVAVFRDQ